MILGIQEWTSHMSTKRTSCWDGETSLKSLKKRELQSASIVVLGQKTVPTHLWSVESDTILQLKTSNNKFLHFSRVERLSFLLISVTTWNLFQVICFRSYKQYQRGDYCVPAPEWRLLRALSLNDINKAYVMHWKSNIPFSLHPKCCSDNWNTIKVIKNMPIPQHGIRSRNTAAGKTGWSIIQKKKFVASGNLHCGGSGDVSWRTIQFSLKGYHTASNLCIWIIHRVREVLRAYLCESSPPFIFLASNKQCLWILLGTNF